MNTGTVSSWIAFGEFMSGIVFIVGFALCYRNLSTLEEKVDDENAEPEDYAIYVRNLPSHVTREELVKHFSDMYDLKKTQSYFPKFLNTQGLAVYRFFKQFF